MTTLTKGAFLAVACLVGTATFTGPSQAGVHFNALIDNALIGNAIGPNSFGGKARGEADMACMALNGMRLDSTTLKTAPGPVWAKDTDPPQSD